MRFFNAGGEMYMGKKRIYLASPTMHGYEQEFIQEAFDTNWIAPLGPNVTGFEDDVKQYVDIPYATATSSGTAAIHLAMIDLGIKEGDIVFCSSLTFSASVNPVMYQGATPVFIDSEPDSWNMSPKALRKAFEKYQPKAVIIVHLYGQPANMDELMEICREHNVPVVEDAAESLGATYKGKQTGTFGNYGIYSFNGNKIITTSGGGMLVSNNKEAIEHCLFLSTQARDKARHYQHSQVGYNYRMSNIVAGIGRGQMKSLELHKQLKKDIYETYQEAFKEIDEIEMQPIAEDREHNYWLSCLTLKPESKVTPLDIMIALEEHNIESRPIWKPMHLQPVFEQYDFFNHNEEGISVSEDIFNRGVCMPSDIKNTKEDMETIISIVKGLFSK